MNYDGYFEKENYFLPWNGLTEAQKKEQQAFQAELSRRTGFEFGLDCVVSPEAHIYEVQRARVGRGVKIASHALLRRLELTMGDDCTVNSYAVLQGKITVGSHVSIAPGAKLFGENHNFDRTDIPFKLQGNRREGIVIGDDVWIGANVTVTDGVKVGSHAVLAAGAVVVKDVPDYALAGGNPARVLRDRRAAAKDSPETEDLISAFGKAAREQWRAAAESYAAELGTGEIRPWCDGAEIAAMFDGAPPFMGREEYIGKLRSMEEDRHGYETVMSLSCALSALGSGPSSPFGYTDGLDVGDYLSSLSWDTDPWDAGHNTDILATAMYFNKKVFHRSVPEDALFGWLGRHICPQTGLWGGGSLNLRINGWYRTVRGSYGQFGLPLPYAERTVDSVLRHKDGSFEFNACNVLDIIYPLWRCGLQTEYRRTEGQAWALETLRRIVPLWRPGFGFAPEKDPVTLKGTEMWLSIVYNICLYLEKEALLGYIPKGVHKISNKI